MEYKKWLNIYTNAFTKSLTNAIALTHLRQWEKIEDTFNNLNTWKNNFVTTVNKSMTLNNQ